MKLSHTVAASSVLAVSAAQSSITCRTGAHIIVARESEADPGFGFLETIKDELISLIPDSDGVAVDYPATITGPVLYFESVPEGAGNMTLLVKEYGDACPGHKMVLMGYSQGAQVVGDVLLGDVNPVFANGSAAIDAKYIPDVAAVVLMGDPSAINNQTFSVGNATQNGIFPRANFAEWTTRGLANRTVSYCDAGDVYCASGPPGDYGHIVHRGYVGEYGSQAVQFVKEKFAAATSNNGTATGDGASTSATPSATTSGRGSATSGTTSATSTPSGTNSASSTGVSLARALGVSFVAYALTWAML